jgi:hypothetical protein
MGKLKEKQIMEEEENLPSSEEQASNQEAYYWHLLHEFVAINKFFGQTKVMSDLKMIRERLKAEEDKDKPRIQLI